MAVGSSPYDLALRAAEACCPSQDRRDFDLEDVLECVAVRQCSGTVAMLSVVLCPHCTATDTCCCCVGLLNA